jgi:hypothetical protein
MSTYGIARDRVSPSCHLYIALPTTYLRFPHIPHHLALERKCEHAALDFTRLRIHYQYGGLFVVIPGVVRENPPF